MCDHTIHVLIDGPPRSAKLNNFQHRVLRIERYCCTKVYHRGVEHTSAIENRREVTCRITRIAEGYETVHLSTGVDQVFLHRGFSFIFPC